jgi:orotate phosphoribosyltransferase
MNSRTALIELLADRSAKRVILLSPQGDNLRYTSTRRLTTMSPDGLALIGELDSMRCSAADGRSDAIGGLTLGADPIAYAISYASASTAKPLRAFTVRKEAKSHGMGSSSRDRSTVRRPRGGDRRCHPRREALALRAVDAVTSAGGACSAFLALVDREEGGREALEARVPRVISLVRAGEILPLIPA